MPLLLLLASPSLAATLTVGSSGTYSTIQSAVNNASSGDTITIAAGTYNEDVDTKGKNLKLVGAGSNKVTINASGNDSAVTVDQGETVTLKGVTLTGSDQGINVVGSTLTGSDLDIYGMTGDSAGGGFLLSDGANVTISTCLVRGIKVGNSAYGGAVFASDSSASFTDCVFKNNESYQGGAFYLVGSTLELTDSSVWGNDSTLKGGGLQLRQGSDATLLRVEIYENSSDDQGGGINIEDSDLSCQNCSITDNQAGDSGGGVAVDGALSSGVSFTGKNGKISGNSAVGAGGGLYVWDAKLTMGGELSDNTVSGSSARGAGLYYGKNKLTLTDLNISGHEAVDGAGVFVSSTATKVVVSGGTWSDNVASSDGGALYCGTTLTLSDTIIEDNEATGAGAGIYVDSSATTIADATFSRNSAGKDGGGLKVYKALATVTGSTFSSNSAPVGAGYYHHANNAGNSKATITTSRFDSNTGSTRGGGVSIEGASASKITFTTLVSNTPDGVDITGGNNPVLLDLTLRNNVGDGLVMSSTTGGRAERLKVQQNQGNGASLGSVSNFVIYASVFDGNKDVGLQLLAPGKNLEVQNCDAVDNGTGVEVLSGEDITILNTISAFNAGDGFSGSNNTGTIAYSDAYGNGGKDFGNGWEGEGQITKDPQYTGYSDDGSATNNLLFLASASKCRDSGDPAIKDTDGSRSDMGSFGGPEALDKDSDNDGFKPSDGDCDESDASVYPGADETWYDGIDSNCDGADDFDRDGDGYRHESSGVAASKVDCNDRDKNIYPGAPETEGDGVDSDCDGGDGSGGDTGDTGDTGEPIDDTGEPGWWTDADGDGYAPSQGDCNDNDAQVSPGTLEECDDGLDNDCDGDIDAYDANCSADAGCGGCSSKGGSPAPWSLLVLGLGLLFRRRD